MSAVQVRGSLSVHQGSVNWHGYTLSCSDPGAVWVAIKAQLALESLLATALYACRGEVLPCAWAAHPILIMHSHNLSLLLRPHLLQLTDGSAALLLQVAAARLGQSVCSGQ